jgi:Ca-activated chloride channel family protein
MVFASGVQVLSPSGQAGEIGPQLAEAVMQQSAGGDTALYDAVCSAVQRVQLQQAADEAAGDRRLYGVVLLSDGKNTIGGTSPEPMYACLPSGDEVAGIKIFTIAYGSAADQALLAEIANRTNGKAFEANPDTIDDVYLAISAEQ